VDRFSVERMTDRYEAVYRRLAASRVPVPVPFGAGSRPGPVGGAGFARRGR